MRQQRPFFFLRGFGFLSWLKRELEFSRAIPSRFRGGLAARGRLRSDGPRGQPACCGQQRPKCKRRGGRRTYLEVLLLRDTPVLPRQPSTYALVARTGRLDRTRSALLSSRRVPTRNTGTARGWAVAARAAGSNTLGSDRILNAASPVCAPSPMPDNVRGVAASAVTHSKAVDYVLRMTEPTRAFRGMLEQDHHHHQQ